jgi:predicted alpha/beta hydrolase family esterase
MRKKVLLLHGWQGSNFPHWQSWLAGELAKNYGIVSFLKFSNFNFPDKQSWKVELIKELKNFKPDIVICHSVSNILWFHLCNDEVLQQIEKLYLVAPPSLECNIEELKSFYPCKLPTNLYAKESIIIASTDDQYMTLKEAKSLQNTLSIKMKVLKNAGHINVDSGYGEWEWMLKELI